MTADPSSRTGEQDLIDEKWARYPQTVLEFPLPGAPRLDLRRELGDPERALLRERSLTSPFAVLTAENPWGANAEDEPTEASEEAAERRNAERRARLERELRDAGITFVRCDGVAPDGDYREHAVAMTADRATAVEIARRYRQLAIFWFDGRAFWLVGALADKPPQRLPR